MPGRSSVSPWDRECSLVLDRVPPCPGALAVVTTIAFAHAPTPVPAEGSCDDAVDWSSRPCAVGGSALSAPRGQVEPLSPKLEGDATAGARLDAAPPTRGSAHRPGERRQGAASRFGQRGSVGRVPRRNCVTAVSTSPSSRSGSIMPLLTMDVIPRTVA